MPKRLFPFVMVAFVTVLLLSNTAAVKVTQIGPFYFDGGTVLFPLSYIFGDILTEVYGYRRSRIVIWTGFLACVLMAFIYWLVGFLPAAPDWQNQEAYELILGQTPRIVAASLMGYFLGEFSNSYVLAKLKLLTKGKWLPLRTISSTVVGQLVDTFFFVFIAFWGIIPSAAIWHMLWSNYIFKTGFEVLATPLTYKAVGWLKKAEKEDYYDWDTDFNPFKPSLKDLT